MLDDLIRESLGQASKQHLLEVIDGQREKIKRLKAADAGIDQLLALAAIREAIGDDGRLMQDELVERVRELARDAARYRHLRDAEIDDWSRDFVAACLCDQGGDMTEVKGERLDAAVDAAMAKEA